MPQEQYVTFKSVDEMDQSDLKITEELMQIGA